MALFLSYVEQTMALFTSFIYLLYLFTILYQYYANTCHLPFSLDIIL